MRIGTAPTDLMFAGRRRCDEPRFGAATAGLRGDVAGDEVALGLGLRWGSCDWYPLVPRPADRSDANA